MFKKLLLLFIIIFSSPAFSDHYYDEISTYDSNENAISTRYSGEFWIPESDYLFIDWEDGDEILIIDFYRDRMRMAKIINLNTNTYIYAWENKACAENYDYRENYSSITCEY